MELSLSKVHCFKIRFKSIKFFWIFVTSRKILDLGHKTIY